MIPSVNPEATGENIDRLRKKAGLSIKEMQKIFGFTTPNAIYKWIRGKNLPTIDNLIVLSHILDTSIDNIVVVDIDR